MQLVDQWIIQGLALAGISPAIWSLYVFLGEWPVAYIHRLEGINAMGCVYTDVTCHITRPHTKTEHRKKIDTFATN
jgi:hypothetical protein